MDSPHEKNVIQLTENGPMGISGDIEVVDHEGNQITRSDAVWMCRCGQSKDKPFCDGSHRSCDFSTDGDIGEALGKSMIEEKAHLQVRVNRRAGLLVDGPCMLVSADGTRTRQMERFTLCRCGKSANMPFATQRTRRSRKTGINGNDHETCPLWNAVDDVCAQRLCQSIFFGIGHRGC